MVKYDLLSDKLTDSYTIIVSRPERSVQVTALHVRLRASVAFEARLCEVLVTDAAFHLELFLHS